MKDLNSFKKNTKKSSQNNSINFKNKLTNSEYCD